MRTQGRNFFAVTAVALVVASVIGGLLMLGSPAQERIRRLDLNRVNDLRNIENVVKIYWGRHENLPDSLAELSSERGVFVKQVDPETGLPYEYKKLDSKNYELCAFFSHDTAKDRDITYKDFWSHGSGRQCFRLEAQAIKH